MLCNKFVLFFLGGMLSFTLLPNASADEILDDIVLKTEANGEVNVEMKFAVPIQYLRHFPQRKSPNFSIYFKILSPLPAAQWQDFQKHRTPPSDVIRDITVITTDASTGPKIQVEFSRPAEFSVSMGKNAQSLIIHVIPDLVKPKDSTTPAPAKPGGVVIPPLIVPAVPAAVPKVPTPTVAAASVKPAAAPVPVAPAPVAAPAIPAPASVPMAPTPVATTMATASSPVATTAVPSGDVTVPNVVLAPSQLKLIHLPLGGKDGLPIFPDIEQVAPGSVKAAPPENLSPAEQLKRANDQAAVLMLQGGNALLAGQPFTATESFNKVLNLPPNKYSQDAQVWVAISREKSGQLAKAIVEFQTYLKLYPNGTWAKWVNDRLAILKVAAPAVFAELAKPSQALAPAKVQNTEFQTSEFGSLGMYYYTGRSRFSTTGGTVQATTTSRTVTDQKSFMSNVNLTAHAYNNEYDNRLVFQDFYAANLLPGQKNNNRLGAAFYDFRDRVENYSFRIGRQSGLGGGVMGRFDGISAGYDFASSYRVNVVSGRLADQTIDAKPTFLGSSVDFGLKDPLGGSIYAITQKSQGITGRKAVGGNLRYFEPTMNIMSMFDYDTQFKALNIFTLQGAYNGGGGGTDYNFILDRRRSPILDIRNSVNGTVTPMTTLLQNGWTLQDLILLANQRTGSTSTAQVGMTNHLSERWNVGTDVSLSKNSGLQASGTLLPDGSVGLEGFVPAMPPSGNTWTVSERLTGNGIIQPHDITNFSVSYSKSQLNNSKSFQFSNHSDLQEKWALDVSAHLNLQSDNMGGKATGISPTAKVSYKIINNLTADTQLGVDVTKSSSSVFQTSTTTTRYFMSLGVQWNF